MRKSTAKKKKQAMKQRQQDKAESMLYENREIHKLASNGRMTCDKCEVPQKNRAFCYFCGTLQRLPQCAHCARTKCMSGTGDCVVGHVGKNVIGMALVGAICDFCEAWVCHSRRCLSEHACGCPCRKVSGVGQRGCWEQRGAGDRGGRESSGERDEERERERERETNYAREKRWRLGWSEYALACSRCAAAGWFAGE